MSGEESDDTWDDIPEDPGKEKDRIQWRSRWLRLFFIPLLVYLAWLLETYLLGSRTGLFSTPSGSAILLYTIITCIVIGIIIPVMCFQRAFSSAAVNMHQLGFRPFWRIWPFVLVTLIVLLPVSLLLNPFGSDRLLFLKVFLLVLPTAVSSVMVCYALIGTHIQAFIRDGGIIASISTGVIVTSVLFAFSALVRSAGSLNADVILAGLVSGVVISVFFFAIRDVWATVILVAICLTFSVSGGVSTQALENSGTAVTATAVLSILSLAAVHLYFSWKYRTVLVKRR